MITRTVQLMDTQIPDATVTVVAPHAVSLILHFFPLHTKMCTVTHVLGSKHQVTVKFTGHASVELVSFHLSGT